MNNNSNGQFGKGADSLRDRIAGANSSGTPTQPPKPSFSGGASMIGDKLNPRPAPAATPAPAPRPAPAATPAPAPTPTRTAFPGGSAPVQPSAPRATTTPQSPTGLAGGGNKPAKGMRGVLTKDANLKYDSYGSARPDGKPTQTLKAGTSVEITNVVTDPKPGQTCPIHVNNIGWIPADAIRV